MAYKKTHDLCVKVRSYQDRNGNNKNLYENIGSIMKGEDGRSFLLLKRYINLAGFPCKDVNSDSITVSMFSSENKQTQQNQPTNSNYSNWNGEDFNSSVNSFDNSTEEQIPF